MAKYLDDNGLLYFWQQLKTKLADKVDKETGKGLSTNDFTTTLKNKLDGIAANAEVNVNADWNAVSGDAQILNKPSVPSKTSDLTNDSNFAVDSSYVHTDNNFTTTLKNKLDGIAAGAEVNVNADWNATSGDAQILNKPDIPSKTSDLTNDSGFITSANVPSAATAAPLMDGTAAVGSSAKYAKEDHRHPSDTNKVNTSATSGSATTAVTNNGSKVASEYTNSTGEVDNFVEVKNTGVTIEAYTGSNYSSVLVSSTQVSISSDGGGVYITDVVAPTNDADASNKKYVDDAIATAVTGSSAFQGTVSAQSTIQNSNYKKGWFWVVDTAGTYVGQTCEVGDMIYAIRDKASAYAAADFSVVQTNLDIASITNAEIDAILAA